VRSTASEGADEFDASIVDAAPEFQPLLRRLSTWAKELGREGMIRFQSYRGLRGEVTLLPRLRPELAGLVTIWNHNGVFLSFFRSVFERRAPGAIREIEACIAPHRIGQGNSIYVVDDDLLAALTRAYRIAAAGQQST